MQCLKMTGRSQGVTKQMKTNLASVQTRGLMGVKMNP